MKMRLSPIGKRTEMRSKASGRRHCGSAVVEFAIAASLFFMLLFSIIDFSYLFWVNLTMQHAVREGTRYAVTGRSDLDPDPNPSATDRCNAATAKIRDESMGLFDRLSSTVVFKTVNAATGATTTLGGSSCYGAGQIIMIQVLCEAEPLSPFARAFFPLGKYTFSVSSTMRNEAFGS